MNRAKVVEVSTHLAATPDRVWDEVRRPALLLHIAAPLVRFEPVDPPTLPEQYAEGDYRMAMRLYGVVPLGEQVISISYPEPQNGTRFIRDNGYSDTIHRWDHLISIAPEGTGTRYADRIEIDAGWRTPALVAFAHLFYRHRQKRWRQLIARDFAYS
ncbi:SRPBCC family protein [Aestuariibius sp. 2305UL40-4]|uniref:SRPBCC family protein n=1 Tax=Aestuariibius violaceus TaxID=3234132 RepID=UPI00345E906C